MRLVTDPDFATWVELDNGKAAMVTKVRKSRTRYEWAVVHRNLAPTVTDAEVKAIVNYLNTLEEGE